MTAAVLALVCFMAVRLRHTFRMDALRGGLPCVLDGAEA